MSSVFGKLFRNYYQFPSSWSTLNYISRGFCLWENLASPSLPWSSWSCCSRGHSPSLCIGPTSGHAPGLHAASSGQIGWIAWVDADSSWPPPDTSPSMEEPMRSVPSQSVRRSVAWPRTSTSQSFDCPTATHEMQMQENRAKCLSESAAIALSLSTDRAMKNLWTCWRSAAATFAFLR